MARLNRREFVRHSSQGLLFASLPAFLRTAPATAFHRPDAGNLSLAEAYTHFGVDDALVRKVIGKALERGGDYADVYFQHKLSNYVGLEDKAVNRAYTNVDYGVGIRVLSGDQTGYSFTEEITPNAMELAAQTAAAIAKGSRKVKPVGLNLQEIPNYYQIETSWEDVSISQKIPYLQTINEKVFSLDKRVLKSSIWFIDESSYILVATSDGKVAYDYQPMTLIYVTCTAGQDGKREMNSFNLAGRQGIEFFTPKNVDRLASEAVKRTVELFDAVKPEGGEMEVVLAAGSSGILLHEAIGHGMEADFNRKKVSIYADRIGKPIAKEFVSIVDNGTNPNIRGSINVDDEATDSQETYLVENGILRSYMHDRISAKHYGVKPTGNGRRQSFRHSVQPRMRNTYMLNGPHTKNEIIKTVKKGLFAESFTNGQVFIGGGDFTFYVKSGYLIEAGKLTKPVKDINIIGNGPKVLENIVMVADDMKLAEGGWTCGKNGQMVPVSQGLPTVKVSSITVGGVSS
jgi:TldD protein